MFFKLSYVRHKAKHTKVVSERMKKIEERKIFIERNKEKGIEKERKKERNVNF